VDAVPANTRALGIGARLVANDAALTAVVKVVVQIGAITPATSLSCGAAVVATSPAVGVGLEIAACSAASYGRAADVTSTRTAQAAGVAVARPAGSKALILLRLVGTLAERLARVLFASPGCSQSPRAEHRASDSGPQQTQLLAARNRLR
jgi:hypothetical protein